MVTIWRVWVRKAGPQVQVGDNTGAEKQGRLRLSGVELGYPWKTSDAGGKGEGSRTPGPPGSVPSARWFEVGEVGTTRTSVSTIREEEP